MRLNLELVKVVGLVNEGIHSHLKSLCNKDNVVTVDLDELSKLFKVRLTVIEFGISTMAFLGLLFKIGKDTYSVTENINPNNLKCGHTGGGDFIPYSFDREAVLLQSIIHRCCNDSGYGDVTWSENFSDVEYFRSWCLVQVGYKERDSNNNVWHIDKDLLSPYDCRMYGEKNCVFLPQCINNLLVRRGSCKIKTLPTGVTYLKDPTKPYITSREICVKYLVDGEHGEQSDLPKHYTSIITMKGVAHSLGRFSTAEAAGAAYDYAKKVYLTEVAEKWKDEIDPRAYQALLNFDLDKLKRKVT